MRILNQLNQEFRWEEECSASREGKKNAIHYRSFFLDDEKFSVGHFVLIRNDESVDPEDISNCYVGQIKDLFDTGDAYEPHQAKVQWYSRVTELPPYTRKHFDQIYGHEVIEEHRPHWSDVVDADTIFSKCEVHFLPLAADFTSFDAMLEECEIPSFLCRYKFTGIKLTKKIKNGEEMHSRKNSLASPRNLNSDSREVISRKKRTSTVQTPKNGMYVAMPTGTKEFPRVLIKKMDDRVLESRNGNVRIIVAKPEIKTVDDVADALKDNLYLCTPTKNVEKRPFIHSLSSNIRECPEIDVLSQNSTPPLKNKPGFDPLTQEVLSPSKFKKAHCLKNKDAKVRFSSRSQSCTPKQTVRVKPLAIPSPRSSARLQKATPKRMATVKSSVDMLSPKSIKLQKSTPKRVQAIIKNINTPSPRVSQRSRSSIATERAVKIEHFAVSSSPSKRKKTPSIKSRSSSPSPNKKFPKTARRSINFYVDHEVAVTRSGRKIKPVNYFSQQNSDDESNGSVLTTTGKKSKLAKFIRANYSDDSGSEFSATGSSSADEESASDCSLVEVNTHTPRSVKTSGYKTQKSSVIKKCIKPTIPERKTPLRTAQNILEESRLRLHVAAVPKSLPCREEEFSDIYSFVKGCLCSHTGGCMYISGVPGTGKTATVHEVIRNLEDEKEDGDVPLFTFVEVNGMWMTDPYQCYVHIFKSLTGKIIASQQAANLLEKRFTESGPKKEAVILLVDELDRLWTRKQTVMYNIFDWPSKKHSKLIVLAIANTMDLPERLMMNRISSRLGLTRKTFQPYNFRQLQEIIMSRIQELQVFDPDAVQFVARKVAAVSGDARRALDICRHATEVAERVKSSPKKKQKILVGMEHVDEAIQQMFSSPVIAAIKSSSKMAKLFLQGMLNEFSRTGLEETTLIKVSSQLLSTCAFERVKPPSSTEISNVCIQLAASHLILVDNFQNDIYIKLRLSVSPDDVNYALNGKGLSH